MHIQELLMLQIFLLAQTSPAGFNASITLRMVSYSIAMASLVWTRLIPR
jgi:hypothetical protein